MSIERSLRNGWVALFGVVWLLFAVGCSSGPIREGQALLKPPFDSVGGSGVVRASEVLPLTERVGRVVVTDSGEEHGALNRMEELTSDEPGLLADLPGAGIWRMSVGGFWVVDLTADDSGAVVILSEVEEAEERRLEYDPPLPLIPAELRMGETIERTSDVSLYNHNTGALEATGTCTATYTLLGTKPLPAPGDTSSSTSETSPANTPAVESADITSGDVVYIIRTDRRYKLPLVGIDMEIHSAYAPGAGPIAGRTVRVVKLLGLIPIVHEQRIERVR